jgi:pimeloyl-ACP methyl ester carboxylesterase
VSITNALADPNTGVTGTWRYVAGATDWRGLSNQDLGWVANQIIGIGQNQFNNYPAFPDRLRQGMLNTLVLARLMKLGHFNVDPTFQTPDLRGVLPGPSAEEYYYGISLGGIMGTYFAALSPDVEKLHVDVPAIDFDLLLQRSTQFSNFEFLLGAVGLSDPMKVLIGLGLQHELWVSAEPASVASHVTGLVDPPLPGVPPKKILMSEAWLDKQVSNQASELMARTLGIGNLEGSLVRDFFGIPDVTGPQSSAMQIWSTGAFDLWNPAQQQYLPPLANQIPSNVCDPHGQRPTIRASVQQMLDFLRPGGVITNKCTGVCDAGIPFEQPAAGLCVPPP